MDCHPTWPRWLGITATAVLVLAMAGCITPHETVDFPPPADTNRLDLQPGDTVRILFSFWPELDVAQTIRPDGMISLHLVPEVKAAGRTPAELREDLLALYADKLKEPEITVVVQALDSRRVYVGGEVVRPGVVQLAGRRTVMDAIIEAGGFINFSARESNVLLVRERDGKRYSKIVNIRHNMSQPEHDPVYLEPYDIVYVPRTAIDRVDQAVEQYLNRVIPNNINWTLLTDTEQQNAGSATLQTQVGF